MNRLLAIVALLTMLAAPAFADNCYSKNYCHPTYRSVYSHWSYLPWPKDNAYYYKVRYYYDAKGERSLENDGYLYQKVDGEWKQYGLISGYGLHTAGTAKYGYDKQQHELAKLDPNIARFLTVTSKAVDVLALLGEQNSLAAARLEATVKAQQSSNSNQQALILAQENNEHEHLMARLNFAENQAKFQAYREGLQAYHQGFAAVLAQSAPVAVHAESDVAIDDPALRQFVSTNCFSCHGGAQGVKAGIDFRQPPSAELLDNAAFAVMSGDMPKGITLSKEERRTAGKLFHAAYEAARDGGLN